MPRGHWIAAIALGLTLAFGALAQEAEQPALEGQPISQTGQEQSTTAGENDTQEQQQPPFSLSSILQGIEAAIRDTIAEEDKADRERQEQREIRDLNAQEDMALWTKRMTWATIAGVILTLIALFAILRTLHHTRRAADYAQEMVTEAKATTAAALKNVSVTEDIGNRQLRPYIVYNTVKIRKLRIDGSAKVQLEVDISFRNCGLSPGIVTAASRATYAPTGKNGWGSKGSSWQRLRVLIGPNQVEKIRLGAIDSDEDGNFSWFTIGVLIWYEALAGATYEDHVWLTFDGTGFRQDYPVDHHSLYRPDKD